MGAQVRKKLPAKLENLPEFMKLVSDCALSNGFGNARLEQINLAVEEVLVNVFNYAYPDNAGDVEFSCGMGEDDQIVVEVRDRGIPFNVLEAADPEAPADILEASIGGLGIMLVKRLMDDLSYRWEDGENILCLVASREPCE